MTSRTALIVGAGIGGLSAGLALRHAGWTIRIVEQAHSPGELGFGIALAPNAIAALRELGVADAVLARSYEPKRAELRRLDGTVVKRMDWPPSLAGPLLMALRPALHGALLEAVGMDAITLASAATGFRVAGHLVILESADGTTTTGDLLVGADGVRSKVRRLLHPDESPPRPSGIVAVRGAVHGLLRHLGDLSAVYYLGRGVEALIVRASDTGIYWFVSMAAELVPAGERDPAAILAELMPRFDSTFRAVASATTDLRADDLVDRDPLPFWSSGRVTLLGDAAHPVLPHTGQGAAQALVDAVTLGQALTRDVSVERALRAYEAERRGATTALLAKGRRTARVMRTTNPVACFVREGALRLLPATSLVNFYARTRRRTGIAAPSPRPPTRG